MFNKILVPFDNGEKAHKALDTAIELAKKFNSEITILTSFDMSRFTLQLSYTSLGREIDERFHKDTEAVVNDAVEKVRKEGIEVKAEIIKDNPGEAIVKYAEKEGIGLITMGSNNRGTVDRMFFGSVSYFVLHNAHCAVLVIKE
ncbi:MAG: universal stress protein [Desulfotomaculaceae bacterium]|nr:universal stress protein [Desulfotomaculaceae bacterium]